MILMLFLITFCWTAQAQPNDFKIKILQGTQLTLLDTFIAKQRLAVFKEYPYLYRGTFSEEYAYLGWFLKLPHTAVAVAYRQDEPVGFLTGTSFTDFDEHFEGTIDLFKKAGFDHTLYYYFGEVIILPEYRGLGLSKQLFAAMENYVRTKTSFSKACFVCEEHEQHPLKPKDYKELSVLWLRFGYKKTDLPVYFNWPTIQQNGQTKEQEHVMNYWIKNLR